MLDFLFGEKIVKTTTIKEKTIQTSKRMYSEEDMWEAYKASNTIFEDEVALEQEFKEWLEQFKKK